MTEIKLNQNNPNSSTTQQQSASGTSRSQTGQNLLQLKKPQSFMYPVYKFVGITAKPKAKERGTLILLGFVTILFIVSITGFFIMWLTEVYNNSYISQLVLANNSDAANLWMKPPINAHLKIHIFNYTNIDRYLKGLDDKIKVQDLGPYTYEQHSSKVDVVFNTNNTVTYKDHYSYTFLPELSAGLMNDSVVIPNVPLMTASEKIDNLAFIPKQIVSGFLKSMALNPFIKLPAHEFLWGYEDALLTLWKYVSLGPVPKKFGMLINRNGTSKDTFQINTGEDDLKKVAIISQFNGMPQIDNWSTDECNRVDGTDGSQFPPHLMDKETNLHVFLPVLCRKLPLEFEKEVILFGDLPAWRYRTPINVFSNPNENPNNHCFCTSRSGRCPRSGILNGTQCYDAPIFPSFPHFYAGDPSLWSNFEGVEPLQELHQTYADIHPRLAFPINGASRIQINIEFKKGSLLRDKTKYLNDGIVLPVLWIEVTNGELTNGVRQFIYHTTVIANLIQFALKYGTLLTCVTSFALLVAGIYYLGKSRDDDDGDNDEQLGKEKEPELQALKLTLAKVPNDLADIQEKDLESQTLNHSSIDKISTNYV